MLIHSDAKVIQDGRPIEVAVESISPKPGPAMTMMTAVAFCLFVCLLVGWLVL